MNQDFIELLGKLFEGVYVVDNERKVVFWNEGSERITGYKSKEVLNKHCYDNILRHVTESGVELCFGGCPLHHTIETGEHVDAKVFLHHKKGHRVPVSVKSLPLLDENNEVQGAIELFTDERFLRDHYQENRDLKEQLSMDILTRIPNRRYLDFYLENIVNENKQFETNFGVLFFDIDDFKNVNDTYGHNIGDEVLKLVSHTLNSNVRNDDVIGRWGGEEFIGIIRIDDKEKLFKIAEKLRILVEFSSYTLDDGTKLSVTVSIGGAMYQKKLSISGLVELADNYMYESKQNGKNQTTIK